MKHCVPWLAFFVSLTCVADQAPLTTSDLRQQLNDPYASVNPIGTLERRIPDDENISLAPISSSSCLVRLMYREVQRGDADLMRRRIYDYARAHPLCTLVLDLSANGGGFVYDGLEIVDLFMTRAHVMSKRDLAGNVEMFETKTDGGPLEKLPLVVVVGAKTASTAEFITWALHDMLRARIVGTRTRGKGAAQLYAVFPRAKYEIGKTDYHFVRRDGTLFHGKPFVPKHTFDEWLAEQVPVIQSLQSAMSSQSTGQ